MPSLEGLQTAVLGLAFKPGTDDVRESPALAIVADLVAAGSTVTAYDPVAQANARRFLPENVRYAPSLEDAVRGAEAILLVTSWPEFRRLPDLIAGRSPAPLVVDGRRLIPSGSVPRYAGIGLPSTA